MKVKTIVISFQGYAGTPGPPGVSGETGPRVCNRIMLSIRTQLNLQLHPFHSQHNSKLDKNFEFLFAKYWKTVLVPCESTAKEVSFEW